MAQVDRFDFFGKEIRLHRNYGAFITMNPGYVLFSLLTSLELSDTQVYDS